MIKNGLGLYSRVARRAKLDDLLFRRERLQAVEANQLKNVESRVSASWPQGGADRLVLDFCACLSTTLQVGENGGEDTKEDVVKESGADAATTSGAADDDDDEVMEEESERGATPESDSSDFDASAKSKEDMETKDCYSASCR